MKPDREKVIKDFEHLLNAAKGNYQDFVDLTVDGAEEVLAMLKEQKEQIKNRDESLEKAREEIKWLRGMMKEQEAVVRCKDCNRRGTYDCPIYVGGDADHGSPDDWFCADGEQMG